jgi:hypothetical protein
MAAVLVGNVGLACWVGVAVALVGGLLGNARPARREAEEDTALRSRAAGKKGRGGLWDAAAEGRAEQLAAAAALVNANLAIATSDMFAFCVVSSLSGLGLTCAFAERALAYNSAGPAPAPASVAELNLWLGVLLKSMAAANLLFDLAVARSVQVTPLHAALDLGECAALFAAVWVFDGCVAPLESGPLGAAQLERLLAMLVLCVMLAVLLAAMPWVRFATCSEAAQEAQLGKALQTVRAEIARRGKWDIKESEEIEMIPPDTPGKPQPQQHEQPPQQQHEKQPPPPPQQQQQPSDKGDESRAYAEAAATSDKCLTSPSHEAAATRAQVADASAKPKPAPHAGTGKQQQQDLVMGGVLCLAGLALSLVVLRQLKR